MGLTADLIYIVCAALVGGALARILHLPLILGYIAAGVVVGPYTRGLTVGRIEEIEKLAEVGAALLLFALGLEFSFEELKKQARLAPVGTPAQLILCGLAAYLLGRYMGFGWQEACWFGAIVALSSTMVVLKSLASQNTLYSSPARVMLAVLIAQDVALVPILLLLPQLTGSHLEITRVLVALARTTAVMALMYLSGRLLLPRIFRVVAGWRSRELFFLLTLVIAVGVGFLADLSGLSFAFGAFVAGMILSETDFNHQALSDVSNLRDLFGLLFFVSIGMLFQPQYIIANLNAVLLTLLAVVVLKAVITAGVVRSLGYSGLTAWSVGLGLSQIGEFAFVVADVGARQGTISAETFSLVIAVAVLSMALTPALLHMAPPLYQKIAGDSAHPTQIETSKTALQDHVVIVGGGFVGEYVANLLRVLEIPALIVESDHHAVLTLREHGLEVIYGDGSNRIILEAAGVARAKLALITLTHTPGLSGVVRAVKDLNRLLPIVARVQETSDIKDIINLGVSEVIQAQLEAGLEMVRQALLSLGIDESRIFGLLGQLRQRQYELHAGGHWEESRLRASRLLEFLRYEVEADTPLVDHTLGELKMRETLGVSVVGILQGDQFHPNPGPHTRLKAGELIGIVGTNRQLAAFRQTTQRTSQ